VSLWPEGSTHGGGGFFAANRTLILNDQCVRNELNDATTALPGPHAAAFVAALHGVAT
jgi:hypothetical protein